MIVEYPCPWQEALVLHSLDHVGSLNYPQGNCCPRKFIINSPEALIFQEVYKNEVKKNSCDNLYQYQTKYTMNMLWTVLDAFRMVFIPNKQYCYLNLH